jgi:hypothetical protein
MPYIPYSNDLIEVEISDRIYSNTTIKQKARFTSLQHIQDEHGIGTVTVFVDVDMYAAGPSGSYGSKISSNGINSYKIMLVADNSYVVDVTPSAAFGDVIYQRQPGQSDDQFTEVLNNFAQPVMLQGDFFVMLRNEQPIILKDLITKYIQVADALGKFQ